MNEQFDDDLKRRISEVFDNYEDTSADEGWMLLREKFPQQEKHRGTAWLWWASAAAVFLLFAGIGIWMYMGKQHVQPDTYATNQGKKPQPVTANNEVSGATGKAPVVTPTPVQTENNTDAQTTGNTYAANTFRSSAPTLGKKQAKPNAITSTEQPVVGGDNTAQQNTIAAVNLAKADIRAGRSVVDSPAVQDGQTITNTLATNQPVQQPATVDNSKSVIAQQPAKKKTMDDVLNDDKKFMAANQSEKKKANNDKLVHFGVFAGTYVNYAKGSDNQVNLGAGVASDFRLSKNFKLSTGVSIAQNSFKYGAAELPVQASAASLVANSIREADASFGLSSAPSIQNYDASLVGIDIPMNLKFEFNPEKNDTYISAGVSSGTFINESYTYRYKYSAPLSYGTSQQVDEKINEKFNEFYLAKTLNVSFGVGYPLGKSNRLVIEPFVKYPLAGLGTQQIKFGSGGINLKLNFQARKK